MAVTGWGGGEGWERGRGYPWLRRFAGGERGGGGNRPRRGEGPPGVAGTSLGGDVGFRHRRRGWSCWGHGGGWGGGYMRFALRGLPAI